MSLFHRETPVVEKVTEKVVEDVEDTPVVASGEENGTTPVEEAAAPAATTTTTEEEETPAVESSGAEVTENGNGDAETVEPVAEAGKSSKKKRAADVTKPPLISHLLHSTFR